MLAFHQNWFTVSVVATGTIGLWGVGLAVARREPNRAFRIATGAAIVVMMVQVGSGLWLYGQGLEPANDFHLFYGVVIVVTLAMAYLYRAAMARRPALSYGLLLLFIMGLGLRAWSYVT